MIIRDETVTFTGLYGFETKLSDLANVELSDKIPHIIFRTNGISIGTINKGTFKLEGIGKCKLLLNSDNNTFMILTDNDGEKIIINDKDPDTTKKNTNRLKS